MKYAIDVQALTRYYNHHAAVDQISFQVEYGHIFGLLGPNGAGKSTTIKMLTTLLPPSSGAATVDGYNIATQPTQVRQHIGYVPQLLSADGELSGYENLALSAKLYGLNAAQRKKRIDEVLDFMQLRPYSRDLVSSYSGGMIRRLEIAQALLHAPAVLFFDEPTSGLDPSARLALWESIHAWCADFKTTILLTTHDMDEADRLCDLVAFMHQGKILKMDTPQAFKAEIGPQATLDDVFIKLTGASITAGGTYDHVKQTRRTLSNLY
jgi:ABC-2 type transport system ATP-binding protein